MRTPLVIALSLSVVAGAQAPSRIPIRSVTTTAATTSRFGYIDQLREIGGGKVLVNDAGASLLAVLDSTLQQRTILADTLGTGSTYPRMGKLIRYSGDSSLFYRSDGRALELYDPSGKSIRVLALPRP